MKKNLLCITVLVMFGISSAFAQDDYFRYDIDKTETVHDKIIPPPIPKITIEDEIAVEWRMHNEKGEDTTYKVIIED